MRDRPGRRSSRRLLLVGTLLVVGAFGIAQLIPLRVSNPALRQEPAWTSSSARALVVASCFDCRSNQTRSHWYTQVAPISWWTASHVKDGRAAVNFSDWPNHHGEGDITEPVINGTMPPSSYTWFGLHPEAKPSAAGRAALINELRAVEAQVSASPKQPAGG
jgi:hypothetical protein